MNEKRLPPRLMVLLVVLKGEKVYKIPLESGIKLDHLKDFNTLRRILTPLVQLYHGVFENEKKKRWTNVQGTFFRTYGEFNYKRGSIFANSPITLIIERQSNPLPFLAYTHPQPP